ncbi:DNA primase [Candidatus Roizmanbacteria bacterium CG09_land_8_20_14_0_10_41_9]|uniref:DNA primase n=1 Tax=Candidatus Roizmanbacteria bacterium CG09_land_8_20_14_0_10_41_9 TaxID=1974850 RepID=A0A2H0WU31_9BACT|nr:MAG: DNA primase [Candidatus Roizmanbacteria bacterium CG09_land_8_20_14_0_10_41_9]
MENQINEIKSKIDIVEFLGNFISLKKAGRNFKSVCPFHQEKTPSFVVSPERQIWHCFGACQEGGDIIRFLMKWENITFYEALRELAEKAGVPLARVSVQDASWKRKERLMRMNLLAADFFHYILMKTPFGKTCREYLKTREIHDKIAKTFQLGYAPQSWDSLLKFLVKKKFTSSELLEAGLVTRGEKGGVYDRFRGRLMFPLKDVRGNIVGFSGRVLTSGSDAAKYVNSPETLLYHKRETLYGMHLAKEAIRREKNVILVEGEFDMISPFQHGIENIVAIKGSAVTREQFMLIKRYTASITLALDADTAGIEAMKRGIEESEELDLEVGVVSFDFAKDPDEAVRKDEQKFKKAISKPIPIYDFLIDVAAKQYPMDDPFHKKKIGDEVIPFIARIRNPIVQSYYVKKLSHLLDVSESSVEKLMRQSKFRKVKERISPIILKTDSKQRELVLQTYVLSMLFQSNDPYTQMGKLFGPILSISDFSIVSYQKILEAFNAFQKKFPKKYDTNSFVATLPSELKSTFDEIYLFAANEQEFESEHIEKLALELRRFSLKRALQEILSCEDQKKGDMQDKLLELSDALKKVEKNLNSL